MEPLDKTKKTGNEGFEKYAVHHVLAHSYYFYFLLFLLGFFLDFLFPVKIFKTSIMAPIGLVLVVLATFLIFWAQKTSHGLRKIAKIQVEHFCRGPYCYTRSPTHLGLFLLTFGFGLIINAFFVVLATVITFFINRFTFLRKQEKILADKYGDPYLEYKKIVKF